MCGTSKWESLPLFHRRQTGPLRFNVNQSIRSDEGIDQVALIENGVSNAVILLAVQPYRKIIIPTGNRRKVYCQPGRNDRLNTVMDPAHHPVKHRFDNQRGDHEGG